MTNNVFKLLNEPERANGADELLPKNPVIDAVPKGRLGKTKPLKDVSVIFTGSHFRGTLLSVVNAACAMGAEASNMAFGKKPYDYREGKVVCEELHRKGCFVADITEIETSFPSFLERQVAAGRRIIVCDDGGYGNALLARNPAFLQHVIGAVEQTTRGVWQIEQMADAPRHAVLALSHSELKKKFECGTVGEKVLNALEAHRGQPVRGAIVSVLGAAGTIGAAVASEAVGRGARVVAFDPAPKSPYWALVEHERMRIVDAKSDALSEADVVVGATGNSVLSAKDLRKLKDGVLLASASSGTYEFPLDLLDQLAVDSTPYHAAGFDAPNGITYCMPWGRSITVLDGGRPINLGIASGSEAGCFDLIMALILTGLAELAAGNYAGCAGILDVFDDIAARHRLPDLYMLLHGENAR
ncbi:SAM1 S-adenosylhomocysteine hydrolase [Rhabdaerophilaceae bacterium]